MTADFTIEKEDLQCLYIACRTNTSFDEFITECEFGYAMYFRRNNDNLKKYGDPKTYSQWINRQIIALT